MSEFDYNIFKSNNDPDYSEIDTEKLDAAGMILRNRTNYPEPGMLWNERVSLG